MPQTPEEIAAAAQAKAEAEAKEADTSEESTEGEDEEEDSSEKNQEELDLDKEIEAERKRGPDLGKAGEAFRKRQAKKQEEGEEGEDLDDEDKPLTRRELAAAEARIEKKTLHTQALIMAQALASSPKEAELIAAKWENRTFPQGTSLQEQIEECYAITHRKRIIGERTEALRALKNKSGATSSAAENHRDGPTAGEPKIPAAEKSAIVASGFAWDGTKQMYKKSLGRRGFLYRDPKSGRTFVAAN